MANKNSFLVVDIVLIPSFKSVKW